MLIILKTADACNLNCGYCSNGREKSGEMLDVKSALALAEQLPEILGAGEAVEVLWHGGEPTLLPLSVFEEIQSGFIELLTPKGHAVGVSMQTNGFRISREWLSCFQRFGVRPGVSLDGPAPLHDAARRTVSGDGSYERVAGNIRAMTDAGLSVSLLCVVSEAHTQDVFKVVQWIKDMDLSVRFNPLLALGRSEAALPSRTYYRFLRDVFMLCCEYSVSVRVEPVVWMIEGLVFSRPPTECSFNGACGRSILALFPGGEVGPCVRSELRYGNIRNTPLLEMWNGTARSELTGRWERLKNREICSACRVYKWCNGGCSAIYGDAPDAENCVERRDFFDWLSVEGVGKWRESLVKEKTRLKENAAVLKEAKKILMDVGDV
jgi:uncharacterized protein